MTITRFTPPLDYLQAASRASLQSYELTRLSHASNLRKEIAALIDQWIQETSEALLARWMLDHHGALQSTSMSSSDLVRSLVDPAEALFQDPQPPVPNIVPAPPRFAHSRAPVKSPLAKKSQRQRKSAVG
jgi:hypothetical protein